MKKLYPYLLVIVQFACLLFLLQSGPLLASDAAGLIVEFIGIVAGLLAIFHMGIGNFSVTPNPKPGGRLVTGGIYAYLRHPMYSAQLVALLPLLAEAFSWYRLAAYLLLLTALLLKIYYEEEHLQLQFPGYAEYMMKTKRLIPLIY